MSALTITGRPTRANVANTSYISKWNAAWHPNVFTFQAPNDIYGSPGKPFYKIQVAIYSYATGSAVLLTPEYAEFRPDPNGVIKADLQAWIQTMLAAKNTYNYLDQSAKDVQLSAPFNILYREWDADNGFSAWSMIDEENRFFCSHSVRKVGQQYGQNMMDYVMFPTSPGSPIADAPPGKFLTRFKNPVYFENYPFDLAFIYSKELTDAGQRVEWNEIVKDVNGALLSSSKTILSDTSQFITRVKMQGGYPSNAASVDVFLNAVIPTGMADAAPLVWNISMGSGTPDVELIDTTNMKCIGVANWTTDLNTTLAILRNSVNTNTPLGTQFVGSPPVFDNSAGYTASYNSGTGNFTLTPPGGSYAGWNGTAVRFYDNGNTLIVTPFVQQIYAGGADTVYTDAVGQTTAQISETKTVLIGAACVENPVYLVWLNPDGAFDYFMFSFNQEDIYTTGKETQFEQYIENLDQSDGRVGTMTKEIQEEQVIAAEQISSDTIEGLKHALGSVKVYLFIGWGSGLFIEADQGGLVQTDGGDYMKPDQGGVYPVWQVVIVKTGSFPLKSTFDTMGRIELTILPPQRFNQQQ